MRVRAVGTATAGVAISIIALMHPAAASAAGDITPPVIKMNTNAGFVVGSVISAADYSVTNSDAQVTDLQQYFNYTITDNSGGICDIEIYPIDGDDMESGAPIYSSPNTYRSTPYAGRQVATNNDYDGQLGGFEDSQQGWVVHATDCSGNSIGVRLNSKPSVTQDNGIGWFGYTGPAPTYSGAWSAVNCACASGHTMKMTTSKGASFTYTSTYDRDDHVGIVMAKGPGRGSADVYVDGVKKATINTYSATNQNRVVMYDSWMSAGTHSVKVVNLATPGHARIDLDAFLQD